MKRHGNLFESLISWPKLLEAARLGSKGKRFRDNVARFNFGLEYELLRIQRELREHTYEPGGYHTFYIFEPKKRLISAAPFRDRVVHHALTQILEPIFERSFIVDSYACRKGKGTHAAIGRAQSYAGRFRYVLKADICKFFPSVDHQVLKDLLARKVKDPHVLWLVDKIIDGSNAQEQVQSWFPGDDLFTPSERRRGIPIGNQTSQFFANVYLNPLDHFLKDKLAVGGYVRYVDDMLVFADCKHQLDDVRDQMADYLGRLRLRLHSRKNTILPVTQGIRFLGCRVFPTHRILTKENVRRFRRRIHKTQKRYATGEIGPHEVRQQLMSWAGHARQANTYRLRERVFANTVFQRLTRQKC